MISLQIWKRYDNTAFPPKTCFALEIDYKPNYMIVLSYKYYIFNEGVI